MSDDLTEYLRLLNCAIRRVIRAKRDGYEMSVQSLLLTEDLRNVMLLGGPLPIHAKRAKMTREAIDEYNPSPQGETSGTRHDQCDRLPADGVRQEHGAAQRKEV